MSLALDNSEKILGIFLDLKKAFDTVSHKILLKKLFDIGLSVTELSLFSSYLSNRMQRVRIGQTISDHLYLKHGVPQGTVLGPILFLIYVNNLCKINLNNNGHLVAFADDTVVLFKSKTWEETTVLANNGLSDISNWLNSNKLVLNHQKTKVIAFGNNSSNYIADINIKIRQHALDVVSELKYLGLMIDNQLKWDKHISHLCKKLRKTLYFVNTLRNIVNGHLMRTVYFSIIQSVLQYGILAWGSTYKSVLVPLVNLQAKIVKACLKKNKFFSTSLAFLLFDVMNIRQIYAFNLLKFVFNNLSSFDVHTINYHTRRQVNLPLTIFRCKKNFTQRHAYITGPVAYNTLPSLIKSDLNYQNYKKILKDYVLNNWNNLNLGLA